MCFGAAFGIIHAAESNNEGLGSIGLAALIGGPCLICFILGYLVGKKGPYADRLQKSVDELNR